MATWGDVAQDARTAAPELYELGRWRSSVSRAYFAVYSKVSEALLLVPVSMPATREGPRHSNLAQVIGQNLVRLSPRDRWKLAGLVATLYRMRCMADYQPSTDVGQDEARMVLTLMQRAFVVLEQVR